jgi:hypothetical protein
MVRRLNEVEKTDDETFDTRVPSRLYISVLLDGVLKASCTKIKLFRHRSLS